MNVETFTVPNGLRVVLHVDHKLPLVNVNLWFHVGAKNDQPGQYGFAHLFEHLMFQGSKNAPGLYNNYIREAGGDEWEGSGTARTTWDYTQYGSTVPSGSLEYLLWLDADRLATLPDVLTQERLDNQRNVVKNERREWDGVPYTFFHRLLTKEMPESLFPAGHPYAHTTFGADTDLDSATVASMTAFFRTYYAPNNASLTIAGDFDPIEARRLVEKYFGPISRGPSPTRPLRWTPKLDASRSLEINDKQPNPRICFLWISPPYFAPGDAELDIAASMLTASSSKLQRVLVDQEHLAASVSAGQFSAEDASAFYIWVEGTRGASPAAIERAVTNEIHRLAKDGPDDPELARAKGKWEYEFVSRMESIGGWGGKADRLNQYNLLLGSPDKVADDYARYRSTTAETLRATIAEWLDTRNSVVLRFLPDNSTGVAPQQTLDRSKVPPIRDDRPFHAPEVKSRTLKNGLQIMVVERPELPKVSVRLLANAGSAFDPPGKAGLADLTVEALRQGTRDKTKRQMEDALSDLAANMGSSADRDYAGYELELLKANLTPGLDLLADMVVNPALREADIEKLKKGRTDSLQRKFADANSVAWQLGFSLAFGADHPYGHSVSGYPSTVQKLTREDFLRFHSQRWVPANAVLICVGDVTADELTALAEKSFGAWRGEKPSNLHLPEPRPAKSGIYVVNVPGSPQTVAMMLLPASPRSSSDFYALQLANAVWGGGSTGRLNLNLRQNKGYSYGFYSFIASYRSAGVWIASGNVQGDKTGPSVTELMKELGYLTGEKKISEQELTQVKANLVRAHSQQFQSLHKIAEQIGGLWAVGEESTEMQDASAKLTATSLQDVNQTVGKYAATANMRLLLVGDAAKIRSQLEELKLREVEISIDGKEVTR